MAHDFVAAIARLQAVLRGDPDFPPAWHQLGIAYFRIQRYGDSIVALERYLELAPQRMGDTRALGHDFYSLGRFQEARTHYERVLAAAPADLEAARGLALALWRVGEIDPALQVLDRLLEREPRHAEAWLAKGMIQFDQELATQALACARRACELDPFEPRAWFLRARAAAESGASDESREARARHERLSSLAQACRSLEGRIQLADDSGDLLARLLDLRRSIADRGGALEVARRIVRSSTASVAALAVALQELDSDPFTRVDAELGAQRLRALAEGGLDALLAWRALARHYTITVQTESLRAVEARIRAAEARTATPPR